MHPCSSAVAPQVCWAGCVSVPADVQRAARHRLVVGQSVADQPHIHSQGNLSRHTSCYVHTLRCDNHWLVRCLMNATGRSRVSAVCCGFVWCVRRIEVLLTVQIHEYYLYTTRWSVILVPRACRVRLLGRTAHGSTMTCPNSHRASYSSMHSPTLPAKTTRPHQECTACTSDRPSSLLLCQRSREGSRPKLSRSGPLCVVPLPPTLTRILRVQRGWR